jgi:hypothetical protein
MFNRITQQAGAFALSLLFTAGILGGLDQLAVVHPAGPAAIDHQIVVITAQRLPAPV